MIDRSSTSTVKLLDAVAVTGAGDIVPTGSFTLHSVQAVKVGTAGAFSVTIEGSLNGTNWDTITTVTATQDIAQFMGVYEYVRANLTVVNAADTVTVIYKWAK